MTDIFEQMQEDKGMTYEDVLEFLEQELYELENEDNPYKPLNFHEASECFEEDS